MANIVSLPRLYTRHLGFTGDRLGLIFFDHISDEYGELRFYRLEVLFTQWRGWPCFGVTIRSEHRTRFLELGYGVFDHISYSH